MLLPPLRVALGTVALLLAVSSCADDDAAPSDPGSEPAAESSPVPAAPDGSYASETGPNEERVTFTVEGGAITHLEGKVYGDCDGITVTESVDGDVDIPIEGDAVDYENAANGTTTSLTGSFAEGTFEGTFAYVRAGGACPTSPYEFTAPVG